MKADNFNLATYFDRIGYQGEAKADLETLRSLMRLQLFTVPFENLDVQAGKIVSLVPEHLVDKVVGNERGGYCYELNGLFDMALGEIGFSTRQIAARPMFYPARRPKTHMAIVVSMGEENWLCDLGFGSYGIREPISLAMTDVEIHQDFDTFQITHHEGIFVLKAWVGGEWVDQYCFDLTPQEWIDFQPVNFLNSKHPESIFVKSLLVIIHDSLGRHVLLDRSLKSYQSGKMTTVQISDEDLPSVLATRFRLCAHEYSRRTPA